MKIRIITAAAVLLLAAFTSPVFADTTTKVIVNGQEIKSDAAPQIINGSLLSIKQPLSQKQIEAMIREQGTESNAYYFDGLSYRFVNIDDDADWEIAAKIDGAVHLGNFFIFDKDSGGQYKLITEKGWKVEEWDFTNPINIGGKKLFKLVTRTGGTGVDIFNAHLVYLKDGNFVEAWQGTLLEHSVMLGGTFYKKIGSYQFDAESEQLYVWETACQLKRDGVTPKGDSATTTTVYLFDGEKFVLAKQLF